MSIIALNHALNEALTHCTSNSSFCHFRQGPSPASGFHVIPLFHYRLTPSTLDRDSEKAVAVLGTVVFPVVNWKRLEAPWWTRVAGRLCA